MSETLIIIPARYESSRFPGKPLAKICDKPMIQWVYEGVMSSGVTNAVYVATDDERIQECVEGFGGKCIMTSKEHKTGTDRIAECVEILKISDDAVVLNIQGDEPFVQENMLRDLAATTEAEGFVMGTLKERIQDEEDIYNSNVVKVVCDKSNHALYFSRSPIPYERNDGARYFRHVGVYSYKAGFLRRFVKLPQTELEKTESLEQLRALENGYPIIVKETKGISIGIDTPQQLKEAERMIESLNH